MAASPRERLRELLAAARLTSRPGVAAAADPALMAAQEAEADAQVYDELSGALRERTADLLGQGDYSRTADIIGLFRRHRNQAQSLFPERPHLATAALQAVGSSGIMDVCLADLLSGDPARIERGREFAVKLEELGVGAVISAIKSSEDIQSRRVLVSVVRNLGKGALVRLLEQFDEERSSRVLERLLEVVWDLGLDELVFEKLKAAAAHPERRVRFKLVEVLRGKGGERSGETILAFVADENKDVRLAAIAALGELQHRAAVPVLTALLSRRSFLETGEDPDLQAAACTALGRIADERAVEPLIEAIMPPGLFARMREAHPAVRLAAARALGPFTFRPDVRETLTALLKDPYLAIQHLAGEVLGKKS